MAQDQAKLMHQKKIKKKIDRIAIKLVKNPKAFTDYWQTIDDVYENLEDYNSTKKRKVLIVFDMIADIKANKKLSPISHCVFSKRNKTQHFTCFYIAVLFQSA